jgi:hypothetical protein
MKHMRLKKQKTCLLAATDMWQTLSIRQHTSAYVSIRHVPAGGDGYVAAALHTSAYVSMRQHTSAYVSIRHVPAGGDAAGGT